jgi:hypothetical protein
VAADPAGGWATRASAVTRIDDMNTVLRRAAGWNRPLMIFVAAMAALAVVSAAGIVADDRVLLGAPIWLKPFKFSVSFVLYATTLAWMLSLLPRRSRTAERAVLVIVAMAVVEMVIIVGQVVRGQTSHFNQTSTLNGILFDTMGTAIMVLFVAQFVVGYVLLRQRPADRTVAYAVGLGLGVSLLGMLAAVPMVLPTAEPGTPGVSGAHSVGVLDGGPGLPVVGWSTTGGDLRIGHFVGLHALQALPLLGFLLLRLRHRLDEATRTRLLLVAGGAYTALTVTLTWQALRGQSIVHPDALTFGVLASLLVATAAATVSVLARRRPAVPDRQAAITAADATEGVLVR